MCTSVAPAFLLFVATQLENFLQPSLFADYKYKEKRTSLRWIGSWNQTARYWMVKDFWKTHKRYFSIQYAFALFCNVIPHQTHCRFYHFYLFDRLVSTDFKSFLYYRLFHSLSFPRILSQTRFLCDCARSTHYRVLFIPLLIRFLLYSSLSCSRVIPIRTLASLRFILSRKWRQEGKCFRAFVQSQIWKSCILAFHRVLNLQRKHKANSLRFLHSSIGF